MTFNKTGAAKDIGFAGLFAPLNSILGLLALTPANVSAAPNGLWLQAGFQKAKFVFS
jgi:hypothetical protein